MEKSIVERNGTHMTMWGMRIACWITKATNTYSEYVILTAFPLQQWLQERASLSRYTHIVCLVLDLKLVTQECAPKKSTIQKQWLGFEMH